MLKLQFQDPFDLSLSVSERMDILGDFVVSPYKLKNYKQIHNKGYTQENGRGAKEEREHEE